MSQKINLVDKLQTNINKIKCLSFFIETQDPEYSKPTDFVEIQQGLVLIFNGIVTELIEIKDQLEK